MTMADRPLPAALALRLRAALEELIRSQSEAVLVSLAEQLESWSTTQGSSHAAAAAEPCAASEQAESELVESLATMRRVVVAENEALARAVLQRSAGRQRGRASWWWTLLVPAAVVASSVVVSASAARSS